MGDQLPLSPASRMEWRARDTYLITILKSPETEYVLARANEILEEAESLNQL